ncbi:MAG: universal stress protein [Melioribacteraceae bacterium]|nr:universal stress protein [Melioribacteraceae bacterium]MCF8264558.1 universal stress protein [Melioribacteraceae bacterium]MCF8413752.1 universal stress protein [Melioribacteraceae bacterium]
MIDINKILVPIDFSDYSKNALKYAVEFAINFNSEMYLLNVVEPMMYPSDFSTGEIVIPSPKIDVDFKFEEELKKLAETEISKEVQVSTAIKSGKPFLEIINYASEIDADLIIIATHGHTGVEHLLFGSTAEKVVRKAPCPVLTLRDPFKGFKFKNES